jgi:SAM-dependent methyltransferase
MTDSEKSFLENIHSIEFSKMWAQMIAFAPVMFQLARSLREFGIIKHLSGSPEGLTQEELGRKTDLSPYSLSVLLDGAESCGLVRVENQKYLATQAAVYLETDELTRANMNFTHDVCYKGMFHLEEALRKNVPAGLKEFGEWPTIYEGLTQLPPQALKSWLEFDHFYSDDVFPRVLPHVFQGGVKTVLDVGGNTGKFACACAKYNHEARITILDYPQQLELAEKESRQAGLHERITFKAQALLDHSLPFPQDFDVIWMSQFLDCFAEDDIVRLLTRARAAMRDDSTLMILEPFIDNQAFATSRFCLNMTSLYFTAMANGQSRMYRLTDFQRFLEYAGLIIEETVRLRLSHTILKCKKKRP